MGAKKKTKKRRRRQIINAVFVMLFAMIGVILSLTVFFPIKEIRVEGQLSLYSEQEIIEMSGIKVGDNLFRFNSSARSKAIGTSLPFIESTRIRRTLSGVVVIEVTEVRHLFAVQTGDGYAIISEGLKVLQLSPQPLDNVVMVRGLEARQPKAGEVLETNDEAKTAFFIELVEALKKYELIGGVCEIDVSDRLNGTLIYENRFSVMIGTANDLDYKVNMLHEMIIEQLRPEDAGFIDVATVATTHRGYFRPGDILAESQDTAA